MAAFSNLARVLSFGLVGGARGRGPGGNPVANAMAPKPQTTPTVTDTALGAPQPPDRPTDTMQRAQAAARRQRKRAAGAPQTLATGFNPTAVTTPRTLIGGY